MIVPYAYLSLCDENPAEGRWDQLHIDRILHGEEHRPPYGLILQSSDPEHVIEHGGILIAPVGHYYDGHDCCDRHNAQRQLVAAITAMPWGVLIATSDEGSAFRWDKIDPWPEHVRLWVMTPRPELSYPDGTRFIGEGSPTGAASIERTLPKDIDVMLVGQGGHERRDLAFAAAERIPTNDPRRHMVHQTGGFAQGYTQDVFLDLLAKTWVAPAPSGPMTQDSFRAFEALEAGAIPILDGLRPGGVGAGYWEMIGMGDVAPVIDDWSRLPEVVEEILQDRSWWVAKTQSKWQQYKRNLSHRLHRDVLEHSRVSAPQGVHDLITAVVLTSPIKSHPDMGIIEETVTSVTDRLPGCEVLICCDGVRSEQRNLTNDYREYLRRLCDWTANQPQVTPFVFPAHRHQSGMMREILPHVHTPFMLFVEHDTPLCGDIPFDDVLATMIADQLNSMRFMHESHVLEPHEHLFLESRVGQNGLRWRETIQFSARPHVARTNWYRDLMATYFGSKSRTMIEDVAHGVVQHGIGEAPYTDRILVGEAWGRWRTGVYTPEGDMKRSGHLDGRAGDPKFRMRVLYDGARPEGAPPEGWLG